MRRNERRTMRDGLESIASQRVRRIKRFYTHLLIYGIGMVLFLLKRYGNAPINFPPIHYINWFFMSIWTFVIAVQGVKLFIKEIVLGKNWENKQIDRILNSEKNRQDQNNPSKGI